MLGRALLGVAMAFAAGALIAAPASMRRRDGSWVLVNPELLAMARRALVATSVAVAGSAITLWYAFFTRDFTIRYVAMNTSRAAQPWYTFSAFWSGMAGSLLLWCLILSIFAAVFVLKRTEARERFAPFAIPILAVSQLFFLTITTIAENPFARIDVVPFDGRGMNPLLHSPGMVIHPPLLYTGLVGLIVPFAIACSAMIVGDAGGRWVHTVRGWTLVPWLALGAGLVLGAGWAYTELGWGGYWGWDPVENAALMPFLVASAFIHSAMVQQRRGTLRVWNLLLVTAAAVLATFGTFLTRSGLLSSVHTFAESPIGRWFFVFLAAQTITGLGLLVWRLPSLRSHDQLDSALSKEATFLANNLVFCSAAAIVLWGTILPLATEAITGSQLAVGPPFFNRVMAPIGVSLLLLASIGTVVPWRRGSVRSIASRLAAPALTATVVAAAVVLATGRLTFAVIVWVAALLAAVSVREIRRERKRPGGFIVHLGIALMVIGFAGSLFRTQAEITAEPGDRFTFRGYEFNYRSLERFGAPDKMVTRAVISLQRGESKLTTLRPQLNFHRNWDQPQSEIAIRTTPMADLYVVLAGVDADTRTSVFRIHYNPLVAWVWAGAVVAGVGGLASLATGRRRRIGPPTTTPARVEEVLVGDD